MARGDRAIGILAGIVLGLIIVALFVFVFSEETVDAPSIDERNTPAPAQPSPPPQPAPTPQPGPR